MYHKQYLSHRRYLRVLASVLLAAGLQPAAAQLPLRDTLGEVEVRGQRNRIASSDEKLTVYAPGQKTISIDSLTMQVYRQQSLAQLLYQQAPVFIRSYGLNGLATMSFRGSSAAQAQVLWNGVPLQNAALGMADVSLMPVTVADRIHIVYGGAAALWGSGNVGGVVLLENDRPVYDTAGSFRMQATAGAGSFGQYQGGLKAAYSSRRWQVGLQMFGQQAKHDFPYTDLYGSEKRMDHSRLRGGGAMVHVAFRPDPRNEFRFSGWQQQYHRQIPPALFESVSRKEQEDESLRMMLSWEHTARRAVWYLRPALIRDRMRYEDPLVLLDSRNLSWQFFQEAGMRRKLGRSDVHVFVPVQHAWLIRSDGSRRSQTRAAVAGSVRHDFFRSTLSAAASFRAEMIDQTGMWLPGVNISWRPLSRLELRSSVQRTYRAPTLNEWFYLPGGNERLLPERGWSEDLGYTLHLVRNERFRISQEATVFNRDIRDWIFWFGGAIWTPHNIAVVNSRGLEGSCRIGWHTGRWRWHAHTQASLIRARTRSSYLVNDGSIGKQIPYTPLFQWQANAGFSAGRWYANYNHTYSGYRYVTIDESQALPAFHTGNIQLMYTWQPAAHSLVLSLQCNNVAGRTYEVMAGRPMPGRNWLAGVSLMLGY